MKIEGVEAREATERRLRELLASGEATEDNLEHGHLLSVIDELRGEPPPVPARLARFCEPVKVLDRGHVRLVAVMGDDSSIVQAARVSYGKGTKTPSDDRALIRYMMRHGHTTPFEMCEIKLHIKMPMDHWRQQIRQRTASVNEYSTRYSEAIDDIAATEPAAWRKQSAANKQGSAGMVAEWPEMCPVAWAHAGDGSAIPFDMRHLPERGQSVFTLEHASSPGAYLSAREADLHALAREVYEERLAFGVAREQARKDLPLSNYTEAYWKIDLHNLFNYLEKRLAPDAQQEIRAYARAIADIVEAWCPEAWAAFTDYRLDARRLSGPELRALRRLLGSFEAETGISDAVTADRYLDGLIAEGVLNKRELTEALDKILGRPS